MRTRLIKVNVEFILPAYLNTKEEVASYINTHLKNNNNIKYVMLIEDDVEDFTNNQKGFNYD